MRLVFLSYIHSAGYDDPFAWLRRINGYIGVLEALSRYHEVISIEQINFEGAINHNGVSYHFINDTGPGHIHKLNIYVRRLRPDVAIVHGMHFPLQIMHLKLVLGRKSKLLLQNHAERPFEGIKKNLQRMADKAVSGYLFTSREMGDLWLEKGIIKNDSKIFELMEASSVFKLQEDSIRYYKQPGELRFLWVGRLDENKDPLTVVQAFLAFARRAPNAVLYMIFHTSELLPRITEMLPAGECAVKLIGKLPHNRLENWYNSVDYIISGSHYEGSGVAVCEAMSCGCIPILTNIASFRKMTGHGKCGVLYEPGDINGLVNALMKIVSRDQAAERQKVIDQFQADLSFNAIAAQLHVHLQTV